MSVSTKEALLMLIGVLKAQKGLEEDQFFQNLQRHIRQGSNPTDEEMTELVARLKGNVEKLGEIVEPPEEEPSEENPLGVIPFEDPE